MQKHHCLAQCNRFATHADHLASSCQDPQPVREFRLPPPFHPRLSRSLRACLAFSPSTHVVLRSDKTARPSSSRFFVMFGTVCDQGAISAQRRGILEGLSSPHRSSRDIFHFRSSAALGPLPSAATHSRTVHTRLQSLTSDIVYPRLSPSLSTPLCPARGRPPKGIITASVNERAGGRCGGGARS